MLDFFHRLAHRLAPCRALLWTVVLGCIGVFIAVLATAAAPREDTFALLSITALVWALLLLTIMRSFAPPLPVLPPGAGLWLRCKWRVRRLLLWILALSMTALCGVVVVFSFRALGALLR